MTKVNSNAGPGSVAVTQAGSAVTEGKSVARTHEHEHGTLVTDSPPHSYGKCTAMKADGVRCRTVLRPGSELERGLCFPHNRLKGS